MFSFLAKNNISQLPARPGVYVFKQNNDFLYIGKSKNIKKRIQSHLHSKNIKSDIFFSKADKIGFLLTESETSSLILEAKLIKKYQPKYNQIWKDDKSHYYVFISKEKFPRIFIAHYSSLIAQKLIDERIGPFVDGRSLKIVLRLLREIFPFRTCRLMPKKPCLYKQIGLCLAPCVQPLIVENISKEKPLLLQEYKRNIAALRRILKGQVKFVLAGLKKEMRQASQEENFEKARQLRDKIIALQKTFALEDLSPVKSQGKTNWQATERHLKGILGLKSRIKRIEGYDISNMQGKQATGSMVVFENGLADKKQYRKFKIKLKETPDDIAMLKEILKRRFNHQEWPLPALILIDGGKAQLNAGIAVKESIVLPVGLAKKKANIKIISLAKKNNELFIEGKNNPLLLKNMPDIASNLILRVRDEAHRFAVSYHRTLRRKDFLQQ